MIISKIKLFVISIVLCFNLSLFSKEQSSNELFNIEIKKKAKEFKNEIYFNKAHQFYLKKNWDSTLVYSMKHLSYNSYNKELKDYCHYFRAYSFKQKKLLKEAKNEFKRVSNRFPFYYKVKIYLGEIELELRNFIKAISYFQQIEKLNDDSAFEFKRSNLSHNLGLCYLHLNKFDKAEKYLFKSAELQQLEKDTLLLIGSYMDIANLYYVQYKDNQAIPYFEKAYRISKNVKDLEIKRKASVNMAVVEENRGDFKSALVYRKEYENWKDSLNDQNKIWAIAELEKKHAVKQKQKEITVLEAENEVKKVQRNGFLFSSILLLIFFVTGIYFFIQKIKNNKIILLQKQELDELNATKDKLFSIVSHDLRSSVNALKTSNTKLINNLESKNYTQLDILLHHNSYIANSTYNLLDNLLNWALLQTKQIYFLQESHHLCSVIKQIELNYKPLFLDKNIHFENTISYDIFVFIDLDSLKIVLRNLLDNAIKFSNTNAKISIYTRPSQDEFCNLVIEDSGQGMNNETQKELLKDTPLLSKKGNGENIGSGLGVQLCKLMIKKNGGKLAIESQIKVGTKFIVSLLKSTKHG